MLGALHIHSSPPSLLPSLPSFSPGVQHTRLPLFLPHKGLKDMVGHAAQPGKLVREGKVLMKGGREGGRDGGREDEVD